ncbi:hypothetical protein QE152_g26742 [Popillia japonica]|uniref:Uncharacterized protein n=1 Tax=Popillia japonica TaxID=7064 RepID=A0AAW1JXS2_POPJA
MGDYERQCERLQKLWDDVLSEDECDFLPDVSEYEPSDTESSDSDNPLTPRKRTKLSSFGKEKKWKDKRDVLIQESNSGIFVEKWKDKKRDVLILNAKFLPEIITVRKHSGEVLKPKCVLEYNKHKAYIDISGNFLSPNIPVKY